MKPETILKDWQKRAIRTRELSFARALFKTYPDSNLYLVGGMVRDLLLGRQTKDYDFVVTNVAEAKLLTFLKRHGRVNTVGRTFGVIKFVPTGQHGSLAIDIALPRLDLPAKGTGAYRDIKVVRRASLPIEEDLLRRDYTVNAIAWDIRGKCIVDPTGGIVDLKKRQLRTVGDAATRFAEDYSRVLRGLRFAVTHNFSFAPATWRELRVATAGLVKKVSGEFVVPREVIAREFLRTFVANPVIALNLYDRSTALEKLIPELRATKTCPQPRKYHSEGSVWKHTALALAALASRRFRAKHAGIDAELVVTVLLHDIAKPTMLRTPKKDGVDRVRFDGHDVEGGKMAEAICERLKLSVMSVDSGLHVEPTNVRWLIQHHLLLLHGRVTDMKLRTVLKYFVDHPLAEKLKALLLADTLGTIPASGKPYTKHLVDLERHLKRIPRRDGKLPAPLLGGDGIMRVVRIAAGPAIGFLKRRLREEQLMGTVRTKQAAVEFIKDEYARTYTEGSN
ncbi:MAG: HD domain-containing protein [Patescibacteria group bacterium]